MGLSQIACHVLNRLSGGRLNECVSFCEVILRHYRRNGDDRPIAYVPDHGSRSPRSVTRQIGSIARQRTCPAGDRRLLRNLAGLSCRGPPAQTPGPHRLAFPPRNLRGLPRFAHSGGPFHSQEGVPYSPQHNFTTLTLDTADGLCHNDLGVGRAGTVGGNGPCYSHLDRDGTEGA